MQAQQQQQVRQPRPSVPASGSGDYAIKPLDRSSLLTSSVASDEGASASGLYARSMASMSSYYTDGGDGAADQVQMRGGGASGGGGSVVASTRADRLSLAL